MSITRKMLKGMGLTEDQQDTILEAHTETLEDVKAERDRYKADAGKLADVQKQLDELKATAETGYKDKYDKEHEAFEKYKSDVANEKTHAAKAEAYKTLLKDAGISDKRLNAVLRLCDVDAVELDEKGAIKGAADLSKSIKSEYSDYIVTTSVQGAQTANPPANNGGGYTKADILKKSYAEQVKLFNQNPEAYRTAMKGE